MVPMFAVTMDGGGVNESKLQDLHDIEWTLAERARVGQQVFGPRAVTAVTPPR